MTGPCYYLMEEKKILRLESPISECKIPKHVLKKVIDPEVLDTPLNQDQANWRVVIFRDEILELPEYLAFLRPKPTDLLEA